MPRILGEVHGINFSGIQKPIGIYIALFGSEIIVDIISQHVAHVQSVGEFTVTNAQALYPEITYILPYSAYTIYVGTPFFYFSCASYFMLHPTPRGEGGILSTHCLYNLAQPQPTKHGGWGIARPCFRARGGPGPGYSKIMGSISTNMTCGYVTCGRQHRENSGDFGNSF